MKKKQLHSFSIYSLFWKKWFMTKLSCLALCFLFSIQVNAGVLNGKTVSLKLKNASVQQLIKAIESQTNLGFIYNANELSSANVISIAVDNTSVEEVLNKTLGDIGLSYEIDKNVIIIIPAQDEIRTTSSAQQEQKEITGRVFDESGESIPGANIYIDGTQYGVISDMEGKFKIKIPSNISEISVSCIGFVTQKVSIASTNQLDIVLKTDVKEIEEVVATGYQTFKANEKTGSIATVKMESIRGITQPSIDKLLQGQVAGMTVMSTSGAPGSVPQIRIRGTSSISGNVQPLWVVDGIILDDPINVDVGDILTNRNLIASGIGGVNVDDIESIHVLKDASATALYGTRAANGVIVITSKKGKAGRTTINYSGSTTLSMRPQIEDGYMMNSKDRIDVNMEMLRYGVFRTQSLKPGLYGTASDFERYFIDVHDRKLSWSEFENKVKELETVNTDWFDHLFRNAVTQRHSINMSGGTQKLTYFVSGSYQDEQATAKGVSQKTYTGMLRLTAQFNKKIRLSAKMNYTARNNDSFFAIDSQENPYEYAINTTRAHRAYNDDGSYNYFYLRDHKYNFLENRDQCWRASESFGITGLLDLEWRFLPELSWVSKASFTNQHTKEENIAKEDSYFVRSRKEDVYKLVGYTPEQLWFDGGYYNGKNTLQNSYTLRNMLEYRPVIKEIHRFNLTLGQEIKSAEYDETTDIVYGYQHDRGRQMAPQWKLIESEGQPYWYTSLNKKNELSFFAVLEYTLKEKYTFNVNARTDGSNRFGIKTNELFQPVWSVGVNYQVKNENFFKDIQWLSYLNLRGSYGSQGNVASQAYSDLVTRVGANNPIKNETYLNIVAPKNPNLKWEKTYTSNAALEAGFFKRRLMFTLEYYNKKAVDLHGSKEISDVTGFTQIALNWASMRNSGFDFSLTSRQIDTDNFRWTTTLNGGYNKNEILEVYTNPSVSGLTNPYRTGYASTAVPGKPINGLWSYRFAGLNEEGRATFYNGEFELDANGNKVLDENGNPIEKTVLAGMKDIDALKYEGTTMPPLQAGLSNTFTYKKLSLSCMFMGSFGHVVRQRQLTSGSFIGFPSPVANLSKELVNRWQQSGDELHTNIPRLEASDYPDGLYYPSPGNITMYNASDLRTVKGDFVRLQNVSLSYNLYNENLRNMGIQNIRLTIQGNNLYVWHNSKLKGQDPEATGSQMSYTDTRVANVSFGNTYLPLPRMYSFSLNVQF